MSQIIRRSALIIAGAIGACEMAAMWWLLVRLNRIQAKLSLIENQQASANQNKAVVERMQSIDGHDNNNHINNNEEHQKNFNNNQKDELERDSDNTVVDNDASATLAVPRRQSMQIPADVATSPPDNLLQFKYVVIGDAGVGKSTLQHRFIHNDDCCSPPTDLVCTSGIEISTRHILPHTHQQQLHCQLQIWDTAGQERYRSLTRSYYRGADAALLVYDVTNRQTFASLGEWLAELRAHTDRWTTVMLVGNKSDVAAADERRREVSWAEAQLFADWNSLLFVETSAKSGENVEAAFLDTAKRICACMPELKLPLDSDIAAVKLLRDCKRSTKSAGCSC